MYRPTMHTLLAYRLSELRVRRAPVRAGVVQAVREWATILACSALRSRRLARDPAGTTPDPDLELVPVPIAAVGALTDDPIPTSTSAAPAHPEPVRPPPEPPPDPDESVRADNSALPRATAEWRRAAEAAPEWRAGRHGPVSLPFRRPLPAPPADHVYVPAAAAAFIGSPRYLDVDDRAFIARKTCEEVRSGGVTAVTRPQDVWVVSPLFVVSHPTTGKRRVIFDARGLNAWLVDAAGSVRYESVRDALLTVSGVGTKLDIQSAFKHVSLEDSAARVMGFVVEGKLMRYEVLPFGMSWSPALFVAALRPAIEAMRRAGIVLVWYVDDIAVFARDPRALDDDVARVLSILRSHGWQAAPDKVYPTAYSVFPFLGLLVDLTDARGPVLRVPLCKANRLADEADDALDAGRIPVHGLRRILGRLEFMRIVVPEIGLLRRPLDAAAADVVRSGAPFVRVRGTRLEHELAVIAGAARAWPARATPPGGLVADPGPVQRVYSDASAFGWGALRAEPGGPFRPPRDLWHPPMTVPGAGFDAAFGWSASGWFSAHECSLSSAAREVRAICYAISALDLRDARLSWHSDATAAVGAIRKWRSPSPGVADALTELLHLCRVRNLTIDIQHVHRSLSLMPVADWLSRAGWREAQAEWAFDRADVSAVCRALGVQCNADLFASRRNRVFDTFASLWFEQGSLGDAFHLDRATLAGAGKRTWWAFPPFSCIERFLLRLVSLSDRARSASTASSSSSVPLYLSIVLIHPPFISNTTVARLWRALMHRTHSLRRLTVWRPGRACLLPQLRLLGDRLRPADAPFRRPLFAEWFSLPV